MSGQAWLIFCAACAVVFALPSPLVFSVASYAAIRGRNTIFASVTGGALGIVTAMTISAIPVAGLTYLPQSFVEIVQWADRISNRNVINVNLLEILHSLLAD